MTDKQIIYECDAKDCEQCSPFSVCCECKNIACYELEKQLKRKEKKLEKIKQFRHDYCMNCEDLLKSSHSCKGCNMVELKHLIEE